MKQAWVSGARVIYIGKATSLHALLRAYLAHGLGRQAGHWGGRFTWQLAESPNLLLAWQVEASSLTRDVKRELIAQFEHKRRRGPFANRVHWDAAALTSGCSCRPRASDGGRASALAVRR